MQVHSTFDIRLGRLVLPLPAVAPATPIDAEIWRSAATPFRIQYRENAVTRTLLCDADRGIPNGVAPLGADGLVPLAHLPAIGAGGSAVPVGTVIDWCGDPLNTPSGYLICDGGEYLRTDQPALFAIIGTRFGRPSTDLKFKVPDLMGRVRYGAIAAAAAAQGQIQKINVISGGTGYTNGNYTFTFDGGTYTTAGTGVVRIVGGAVERVDITLGGVYSDMGAPVGGCGSNVGIRIPLSAGLGGGNGFSYEVVMRPVSSARTKAWSIRVTNRGATYIAEPAVTISGGSLTGATGRAILGEDASIQAVVVTNYGNGPVAGATVTIAAPTGPGTPVTATAEIISVPFQYAQGDYGGEDSHWQGALEVGDHAHQGGVNTGGSGVLIDGDSLASGTPGILPAQSRGIPLHPVGVGIIPLIKS